MSGEILTRLQFWGDFEPKEAEASGTGAMPHHARTQKGSPEGSKTVIKTSSAAVPPDDNLIDGCVVEKQPEQNAQSAPLVTRIDTTGKEPPKLLQKKEAQHYALPALKRYPLDGYDQVEKAAEYFDEHKGAFSPEHRRTYCQNLVKRAHALSVPVSPTIEKYGSASYAPPEEIQIALEGRRNLLQDDLHVALLDKLAEQRAVLEPELFAQTLLEFDKLAHLDAHYDRDVLDPHFSTFGVVKTATTEDEDGSFTVGNDYVTKAQLRHLAMSSAATELQDVFTEDFMNEFKKDPIAIFSSMPVPQKKIIARIANDAQIGY